MAHPNLDFSPPRRQSRATEDIGFRTIGEVADEIGVPQHVLRFWEKKFGVLMPLKRPSGRRYYRPNDIKLLWTIRDLLYQQGYTIRGVQKVLKKQGFVIGQEKQPPRAIRQLTFLDLDSVREKTPAPQSSAPNTSQTTAQEIQEIITELTEIRDQLLSRKI